MSDNHFTAWLTTSRSVLNQDYAVIEVMEDENLGDENKPKWACAGSTPVFEGITETPAEDGNHAQAQREAAELLGEAGWTSIGRWEAIDTGYVITVERA